MSGEADIRAKLRELADVLGQLAQYTPGDHGAELERCARDVHPGPAPTIRRPEPGPKRRPRLH